MDPWTVCWLDDCRLRLWLSTRRLEEAIRWAEMSGLSVDDQFNYHHDLEHTNLAVGVGRSGYAEPLGAQLDEALHLLDRLFAAAEAAGWIMCRSEILVLQSLARQARGDREGGTSGHWPKPWRWPSRMATYASSSMRVRRWANC